MRRVFLLLCCLLCMMTALPFSVCGADSGDYPAPEVLQIDLIIQPYRFLKMIHSEEKKKYDAVVCMNEGAAQPIGVQIRGDSSLREGMESASKRVPLELCFDYAESDGAFHGNPSLKLINCQTPARLLTQLIAMQAFAFLEVPTPNVTPAFIRINDTDFGLYLAVEDLNDSFVQNRFGSGVSLYRAATQKDDPSSIFLFGRTRIIAKSDHGGSTVSHFNDAKNSGRNADVYLDVDEILRYLACEAFLTNEDGFLSSERNFYLADNHGKLTLIPWDKDDVFIVFAEVESLQKFEAHAADFFDFLMQNADYYTRYRQYIRMLNDDFLNPDTFLPWLEQYIRVLTPYFQRDETISRHSDDIFADLTTGNALYNTHDGNLLLTFRTYHDQLDDQLAGRSEAYTVPQGLTVEPYETSDAEAQPSDQIADRSVIFRVCSGYWRLRRQAFLQNDGKVTLCISIFFALVFACAVFSVYRPMFRSHRLVGKNKPWRKNT